MQTSSIMLFQQHIKVLTWFVCFLECRVVCWFDNFGCVDPSASLCGLFLFKDSI